MTDTAGAPARPRWDLVGLAVRYRRDQLGYRVDAVAAHVGVSAGAWRTLESGARPSGFHKEHAVAASTALGWTPDSLTRIVRGRRPIDAPGAPPTLAPSGREEAVRTTSATPITPVTPVTPTRPAEPVRPAPWFLAPISARGPDGVRSVDPARLGVVGGLLILVAIIAVFLVR